MLWSEFSPCILGIDISHPLQLSRILSLFIKRKVPCSPLSSACFLARDHIISVFVSSHLNCLHLSSILNLPSVLDCLPSIVGKFCSPPLVAWKYVKTSGKSFSAIGSWEGLFMLLKFKKIMLSGCDCNCYPMLIPTMVIPANLDILSRPSQVELFSRGTKFKRALLSHLSIEEAIEKGLKKFVNKQEELLGVQGILSEWKAKVLLFVQKRTCSFSVVQSSSNLFLSVPLGDLDHLQSLQCSLVITYMDKCSNNFVFVC
jgi:hypothetical protein